MKKIGTKDRRRRQFQPKPEGLETRQVMTAGAGNTLAIFPAQVAQADQPTEVSFTVDPANFTYNRGRIQLGLDVASPHTSQLSPTISGVQHSLGGRVRIPKGRADMPGATLVPLAFRARQAPVPVTVQVEVSGDDQTTGDALLGLYLPGDANGDGEVTRDDLKDIRSRLGTFVGDPGYSFDADSNRDGIITMIDLAIAQRNLGAKSTIAPIVTSDLDPETTTGAPSRVTARPEVRFTGVASGGANLTYSEVNQRTPDVTTTAEPDGTYSIDIPLAEGINQFQITSIDTSGQTISGVIDKVTYNPVLAQIAPSQHGVKDRGD